MRVLQINDVVNSGSTGRIAEDIGTTLIDNNHESYITYAKGDRPSKSHKVRVGNKFDIYSHGLKTLLTDKHGLGSKGATKKLIKDIDVIKPDIIGLHNIHGYYLNYKILFEYIKRKEIPVLWTLHDCWPFTGHCAYFERFSCEKWKTQCHECPLTNYYPRSFVDRSFDNYLDKKAAFQGVTDLKIITPSHWLKKYVKQSFLKDYPVEVIHNGIDLNIFKPNNKDFIQKEKIVLGVASVWHPRKGLFDFEKLRKILPSSFKIVLIGLTKKQISKLPEGIIGISRTENIEALVKWYNRATVFVNPTYIDNFPTTNIEAIACGTPVITYNTGGSPEAIDKNTGIVVDKGDVDKLAEEIQKIQKDKQMIANCRLRAESLFDSKQRFLDYLKLYLNHTEC
jgi:glycosyltransferase involved in cell wall biosynthesis